jgi:hypothetical protein
LLLIILLIDLNELAIKFYVTLLSLLMSLFVISPASEVQQNQPWDLARVVEVFDGAFLLDEYGNMRHWFIYP